MVSEATRQVVANAIAQAVLCSDGTIGLSIASVNRLLSYGLCIRVEAAIHDSVHYVVEFTKSITDEELQCLLVELEMS